MGDRLTYVNLPKRLECHLHLTFCVDPYIVKGFASTSGLHREEVRQARPI